MNLSGIAEGYLEKALSISQDTGDLEKEFMCLCALTVVKLAHKKIQEKFGHVVLGVEKSESLRAFLRDNDQFKYCFQIFLAFLIGILLHSFFRRGTILSKPFLL